MAVAVREHEAAGSASACRLLGVVWFGGSDQSRAGALQARAA